ncbi:MAG: type VI secretion system baseplate subunit TssE [Deltaproteobacteria bacterium]|jgi:type VI secretion system lysozyme-like protein|nr:type VI secretion system baseplate subunit TssE [Deltaproteobacteria bacterium]
MRLRLLERVRAASGGRRKGRSRSDDLLESLETHLSLILNTRQGSSKSAMDYGMPDFVSLMGRGDLDAIRELSRVLTEVVQEYEPRIADAAVTYSPGGEESGVLEFSLSGSIEIDNQRQNIFFQTSINPDGAVNVRK